MPHFWNNILVVTTKELVPRWWKKESSLLQKLHRERDLDYGIKRARYGRGKGGTRLVKFDSLPKHIQEALGDPRKQNHILEKFYEVDAEAVNFYSSWQFPSGSYLSQREQERYITDASVVRALLRLEIARKTDRQAKGGSMNSSRDGRIKGVTQSLCDDAQSFQEVLQKKYKLERGHGLPKDVNRFRAVLKTYKERGYVALIKDAAGKRRKNAQKMNDSVKELLDNLFGSQVHKPQPTEVAIQYADFLSGELEIMNNETGELYNPESFKKLGKRTITNYLASWESKIGTHALRNGNRQRLIQDFIPRNKLKPPIFAGSLISIDDRQPPFWYDKGKRAWFYLGMDVASKCFTTWVWGKTKEGIILDFYRQMIRNYHEWGLNLPLGLECESSLNSSFRNTFLRNGVMFQDVRIEANNARGKMIEREFRDLRLIHEKTELGWIPRPFAKSEPNQISNIPKKIIPYKQLIRQCLGQLQTWNNCEHPRKKGITRWEYFLDNQSPDLKPTNYKALLPNLGFATKTSCRAGIIRLQREDWLLGNESGICTGESLIRLMHEVEGEEFTVYWLDDNDGQVFKAIIVQNDRYICELHPMPSYNRAKAERKAGEENARELMSRYVATVRGFQKLRKRSIDTVTVIDERPRTLNNKFKIRGLEPEIERHHEAEVLDSLGEEDEYDLIHVSTGFKRPLSERY